MLLRRSGKDIRVRNYRYGDEGKKETNEKKSEEGIDIQHIQDIQKRERDF